MLDKKNNLEKINGSKLKICIIASRFNNRYVEIMLSETYKALIENNVKEKNITTIKVAGSLEIPYACQKAIDKHQPDAIITLGVIIRGDTSHYEIVCNETFRGIMDIQLKTKTPISFGILTCENKQQVELRASDKHLNKGRKAALAALHQTQI